MRKEQHPFESWAELEAIARPRRTPGTKTTSATAAAASRIAAPICFAWVRAVRVVVEDPRIAGIGLRRAADDESDDDERHKQEPG
jgi:hypothetical protein